MACYNAERFIGDALASVVAQTYSDFELIVVDDGSTDNSAAIVEKYVGPDVKLIEQGKQGAASARNVALRYATGRFVLFLDADDIISPSHLESLAARSTENPGCVALSRWDRFRVSPTEATFPPRTTERDLPGPDWLELDWDHARPMTQSGMVLLPRALLDEQGGWDERLSLHDDFEFFARMISASCGVRFAPQARLYYRSSIPGSLSSSNSEVAVQSAFLSLRLGTDHLLRAKDSPGTRRVCANLMQEFEFTYFPKYNDLRAQARTRVKELGGSDREPDGPPAFQYLRHILGWKGARLAQIAAHRAKFAARPGRA